MPFYTSRKKRSDAFLPKNLQVSKLFLIFAPRLLVTMSMAREEIVKKWLEIVEQDLQVAQLNHDNGYWLYAAFLCHQALEKSLKAYWVATQENDPPFTHSHTRLLSGLGLIEELTDEQLRFISLIEPMYIEARYPEQKVAAARSLSKDGCLHIIETTKELTQWIEERLPETKPSTPSDATSK